MKITCCLYELKAKKQPHNVRRGSLLKVTFDNDSIGYADCHPWEELEDLPLPVQLASLKDGKQTALTARSIQFAKSDADARAAGISLFQGLHIPDSHFLIPNLNDCSSMSERIAEGFNVFKIKLGSHLEMEIPALIGYLKENPDIHVRLDFNCKLTSASFQNVLDQLSIYRPRIDYVEDPFPFSVAEWRHFQNTQSTLACDHLSLQALGLPEAAKVLIIKPAIQSWNAFQDIIGQRLVFTSYLDHPLGQVAAA